MKNLVKSLLYAFAFSFVIVFSASADDKEAKKITGFGTGIYTTKEGKIRVNVDKFNKKATVILLEDSKGKVLHQEVVGKNETKFRRLLDMSQLPTGEYTLKITSDGEKQIKKLGLTEKLPDRMISMN